MTAFTSRAELAVAQLPTYIDRITDRLMSFQSQMTQDAEGYAFTFQWGNARLQTPPGQLNLEATAETADGLARLKDILATAVELYAKDDSPKIVWQGDLSSNKLAQFRLATVVSAVDVTPHMRRVRLKADDLARFENFGGMHIRMLLPTLEVPAPIWPEQGPNGLPLWPDETRKPVARVYTIRTIDVAAGHFDVDMVVHGDESLGSAWALSAKPGDEVGIMGPLGRPVADADWYVMGADETAIPAVSRMLARLPQTTRGVVIIEVADAAEMQDLYHPGFEIRWIHRNGIPAGEDTRLADAIRAVEWPTGCKTFGWFAAESTAAASVREYWRTERGLGRDQTLAAAYWRIGAKGVMAG